MDNNSMPHNVEGFNFENLYPDARDASYGTSWGFAPNDNLANTTGRSTPLYSNWQTSAQNTPLESYGRPMSKSPSFSQHAPYSTYGDLRQFQPSPYDPSLVPPSSTVQHYGMSHATYGQQPTTTTTIAPRALENGSVLAGSASKALDQQAYLGKPGSSQPQPMDQIALCAAIPRGASSGIFAIIDYNGLSKATNSQRLHTFVNVSQKDFEYPINKAALPAAPQRRSRNELRRIAGNDPKLLAKLGKKQTKKPHHISVANAPLKPRIQLPSGVKTEYVSSSEESSSEEESDEDLDDELGEPSPLPAKRPDSPLEATRYDTIKALWRSKVFAVSADEIRTGLKDYWEVVRTIRDRWKTDSEAVIQAEEKKRIGELPLLKSRVKDQRDMIEVALKAALDFGHRNIMELSGENKSFLYLLYQFLLERFKANDMDGPLPRSILEILAICTTLTEDALKATNLAKVLPRFSKKGNAETQALVKRIESAAQEFSKKRIEATPRPLPLDGKPGDAQVPPAARHAPEAVAGVKRAAPSSSLPGQPPKRIASGVAGSASAGTAANKLGASTGTGVVKRTSAVTVPNITTPISSRPKPAVVKPSAFFTSLQSAPKKANAAPAIKPAAAAVTTIPKPVEKKPAAMPAATMSSTKSSFSFADTMANLNKPKAKETTPKLEEPKLTETAVEKKKRLRKEMRRSLRVTFRPESSLVEVRYFTHDPEEELGHDASMMRDVSDVGGEGRMFKQHQDAMDLDEEDDEPSEVELHQYRDPVSVDFSTVEKDERDRNYAPYGGGMLVPESAEKDTREQHEATTLMVFYTHKSDIPPSPKEPTDPYNGDTIEVKEFGSPSSVVLARAAKFAEAAQIPAQPQPLVQQPAATPDIAQILAALNPQAQQPSHIQQQQAPDLQRILANLSQNSAQQAPVQATQAAPSSGLPPNLANIFASLQPQSANPPQTPAQQALQPAPTQAVIPDLAALLGQFGQNTNAAATPLNPNLATYGIFPGAAFNALPTQTAQQQQQQSVYENEERRRWREGIDDNGINGNNDDDYSSPNKRMPFKKKKDWATDKMFTQPCKYWGLGKCQKGANCTYKHEGESGSARY